MEIQRTLRLRAYLVYGLLIVFALSIAVKLFTIQLVEGDKWVARSEHVATAYRTVQPDRGHIYSEDGRFLSTSVPEYEVRMDLMADGLSDELFRAELDPLCQALSELFADRTAADYRRDLPAPTLSLLFWDAWEGALLRMKIERHTGPLRDTVALLLDSLLAPAPSP